MKRLNLLLTLIIITALFLSGCDKSNGGSGGGGSKGPDEKFQEKIGQGGKEQVPGRIFIPGRKLWDAWKEAMDSLNPGLVPDSKEELEDKLRDWGYSPTHPGTPDGFDTWELQELTQAFLDGLARGSRDAIMLLWAMVPGGAPIPVPQ